MSVSLEKLQQEYYTVAPVAARFATSLKEEIEELLRSNKISLGVPIEYRVKKFESISEKVERKSLTLEKITDVQDLIGIRVILLFARDAAKTSNLISETFTVLHREDTQSRLTESQFGYQSFHFLIKLPDNWLTVPSFASTGNFTVELQIRTLAQHIWAAASHVLQYKQETSVPMPVRRSIYRVSALLETIDLEFERVLDARESYVSDTDINRAIELLNVDLLKSVLDSLLPPANKDVDEPYAELLPQLLHFGITTPKELQSLVYKHLDDVRREDFQLAKEHLQEPDDSDDMTRLRRGVFFSHTGLLRRMLKAEVGDEKYYEYYQ